MIELFSDLYSFILSGVSIGLLIAALFVWYCIHKDIKDRKTFDDRYRKSRNIKNGK